MRKKRQKGREVKRWKRRERNYIFLILFVGIIYIILMS